jgi:trimeric autotransporter adhesin
MQRSFKKHGFGIALGLIALGALVLAGACKSSSGDSDDPTASPAGTTTTTTTTTTTSTAGTIKTIAGTGGSSGYTGDGGAATSAKLCKPWGMAFDSSGNLYIADYGNHVIRKITSTGYISTIAGTGTAGYSGDGGAATSAMLNSPTGVAVDSSDDIYIADCYNHAIRKVTTKTGKISTVVGTGGISGYSGDGGAATSAKLYDPKSVAFDPIDNLYIADTNNQVIRKVTALTGNISTFAGTGTAGYSGDGGVATSATLKYPNGVAIDSSGNLYIADTQNYVIRKVAGIISTVAGTGSLGYSGDGGAATSAKFNYTFAVALDSSDNLYIADGINSVIRKVTAATGYISTVAGTGSGGYSGDGGAATSAKLSYPFGVALDSSGNIYIADYAYHVVREVLK